MAERTEGLPVVRRDRSPEARKAARARKAERERRIVGMLNAGVSVAEIADREGVTLPHMRNIVRDILARRQPQPPAEYLALQVSRLNEALLVSYSDMQNGEGANLKAVDRVVRIVREMDRYHGFATQNDARPEPPRLPKPPLALPAPSFERSGEAALVERDENDGPGA